MFRKVREDCSERTDAKRIVARNREVVLAQPLRSQAKVAAGLACHLVSKAAECAGKIVTGQATGSLTGR